MAIAPARRLTAASESLLLPAEAEAPLIPGFQRPGPSRPLISASYVRTFVYKCSTVLCSKTALLNQLRPLSSASLKIPAAQISNALPVSVTSQSTYRHGSSPRDWRPHGGRQCDRRNLASSSRGRIGRACLNPSSALSHVERGERANSSNGPTNFAARSVSRQARQTLLSTTFTERPLRAKTTAVYRPWIP